MKRFIHWLGLGRFNRFDIAVLGIVALCGLLKLPQPFMGDQAWFTVVASKLDQGGVLLRDVWETKQPGFVFFYYVAGSLFGFTEVGIHAFELLYMLAFSGILIVATKDYFVNTTMASLSPLFVVGVYYGVAGVWFQTQAEILVEFPIFLTLWFALQATRSSNRQFKYWFVSGMMGGIVLLFKLVYLPIIAVFWMVALYALARSNPKSLIQSFLLLIFGTALPLLSALLYFFLHDALELAYWTYFQYPVSAISDLPLSLYVLRDLFNWFTLHFSSLMALSIIGAYASLTRRPDNLSANLIMWILFGAVVILVQRSWYEYHIQLLLVPFGLLAARGVDAIWSFSKKSASFTLKDRLVLIFSFLSLFLYPIGSLVTTGLSLARDGFALNPDQRFEYQVGLNKFYQSVAEETAFLSESESLPGDIFVIGDPLYYFLSGRNPAIPLPVLWFRVLPEQWDQINEAIHARHPPYIFVATDAIDVVRLETSADMVPYLEETVRHIQANYVKLKHSNLGDWYILRDK